MISGSEKNLIIRLIYVDVVNDWVVDSTYIITQSGIRINSKTLIRDIRSINMLYKMNIL